MQHVVWYIFLETKILFLETRILWLCTSFACAKRRRPLGGSNWKLLEHTCVSRFLAYDTFRITQWFAPFVVVSSFQLKMGRKKCQKKSTRSSFRWNDFSFKDVSNNICVVMQRHYVPIIVIAFHLYQWKWVTKNCKWYCKGDVQKFGVRMYFGHL